MNICITTDSKCISVLREVDLGRVTSTGTFVIAQEDFGKIYVGLAEEELEEIYEERRRAVPRDYTERQKTPENLIVATPHDDFWNSRVLAIVSDSSRTLRLSVLFICNSENDIKPHMRVSIDHVIQT